MGTRREIRRPGETVLAAILILFFFQLLGVWIESIYRLSLIKLAMGAELLGILLPLLFLPIAAAGRRVERGVLAAALLVVLVTRALCPLLSAPWLIVNAGVGVAACLALACHVLSGTTGPIRRDLGVTVAIAVLLSILLRVWGSSYDLSMGGPWAWLGWVLAGLALVLLLVPRQRGASDEAHAADGGQINDIAAALGLFANAAIIYLVLLSPAVVSAWCGADYLLGTALLVVSLVCALGWMAAKPYGPSRSVLLLWNGVFVVALVAGIRWNTIVFPATSEAPAVFVGPPSWRQTAPLYLMLLLAGVVPLNIAALAARCAAGRPRRYVAPVTLGMAFLTLVTMLLIFTNVWGYVGIAGDYLRNRFYLPFLIAGAGMIAPWLIPAKRDAASRDNAPSASALPVVGGVALALLAITGVVGRAARPAPADESLRAITVLTYNMQQGSALEGDQNYWGQLARIRAVAPDIIGLQESDVARPSGGHVDAARFFAEALGFYHYYGPNAISGTFGTAIVSRFPLHDPVSFFSYSTTDEIGTAAAVIEAGGRRIAFFNSHPAGRPAAMQAHVDALMAEVRKYDHVIAVGDYNFRESSPYYEKVVGTLTDSWRALYPDGIGVMPDTREPLDMTQRIDHIFVSPDFEVVESHYIPAPASQTDHPAHWSIIRWE